MLKSIEYGYPIDISDDIELAILPLVMKVQPVFFQMIPGEIYHTFVALNYLVCEKYHILMIYLYNATLNCSTKFTNVQLLKIDEFNHD